MRSPCSCGRVVVLIVLCSSLPAWSGAEGGGQGGKADQEPGKKAGPTKLYFGVEACVTCHTKPGEQAPLLCRCNELPKWQKEDKHKEAWNALKTDRAKHMGEFLHVNVSTDRQCVSCHGVYVEDEKVRHRTFQEQDGVSCVACHGAYKEWVALHGDVLERDNWRGYTREVKEEQYGMRDLWDPARRARLCASCHVGDAEAHRVVTHAMYAAGHPPLPGFEVATFSDKMPRHWQYLKEKDAKVQTKLLHVNPDEAAFEQTQLVAVGEVVALDDAARLLAAEAGAAAAAKDPGGRVLDFANFDCYACHHDLKSPSWRQQRGSPGWPGRPQMRPWPVALARVSIRAAGGDDKVLNDRLKRLSEAFDATPFGDPKKVAAAAQGLSDWLTPLTADLARDAKKKIDKAASRRLLSEICLTAERDVIDYDAARQLAWAFQTIYPEAVGEPTGEVREGLEELNKELKLDIPATQQRDLVKELPDGLAKISNYDPKRFKATMAKLSRALPAK